VSQLLFFCASKLKDETQARPSLEKAYDHVNQSLKINPDLASAHLLKPSVVNFIAAFENRFQIKSR